jgi:hypothetical protein
MSSGLRFNEARMLAGAVLCVVLAACGEDPPPPTAPIAPAPVAEIPAAPAAEPEVVPDASIEAVVVDANATTTVAGEEGRIPTPEAPVIEVVAYEDLAFVVGERVIVRTSLGSTREGILKRYFNTGLKVLVNERGREMELDMPRNTVDEVKVVWTHAQGAPADADRAAAPPAQ